MKNLYIAILAAVILVPNAASAFDAVVVPATRKVVPTASMDFPTYTEASLAGCRNEWESFQILIRSGEPVTGIDVAVSDLANGDSGTIPGTAAVLYREWFLNVVNPSGGGMGVPNHERVPGLYPDPLIPFKDPYSTEEIPVAAPFDITADDPGLAVVWIDVLIPKDAAPGIYTGKATVTADGVAAIEIPVSLQVWELDMPSERGIRTSFRMSEGAVRSYHGGREQDQTSEDFPEIVRNYYIAGHENRIDPTGFTGPVSFEFNESGDLLDVDWTAYDAYMEPYLDGSYFGDGIGVAGFDVGMFGPGRSHSSLTDDQYKKASAALAQHLYEKGWWDRAWVYSKDEPWLVNPIGGPTQEEADASMAAVANDAKLLTEGSDLWKGHILVTGSMFESAAPYVGIWCPVQPMYGNWYWTEMDYPGRGDYDQHIADGGQLWFYNCNGNIPPYAGYDIDTTIGYEPRILKWGSWWEGATGYLYWRQLYWGKFDPWLDWQAIDSFGLFFARNGDGLLMYPGDSDGYLVDDNDNPVEAGTPSWLHIDGPVVSFRLKQIRDGLEDWELFILAEKAGIGDWTRNEMTRAYRRFGNFSYEDCETENYYCPADEPWTLDESVMFDVRARIAAKLLFTLYPDRYPDPDEPQIPETTEETPETVESPVEDVLTPDAGSDTADVSVTTDTVTDTTATVDTGTPEGDGNGCTAGNGSGGSFAILLLAAAILAIFVRRRAPGTAKNQP